MLRGAVRFPQAVSVSGARVTVAASSRCNGAGGKTTGPAGAAPRMFRGWAAHVCNVSAVVLSGTRRAYHTGSGGQNYAQLPPPYAGYMGGGDPTHSMSNNGGGATGAGFPPVASGVGGNGGGGSVGGGRLSFLPRSLRGPVHPSSFIERVPRNTILNIVPQGRQYVVERLGRYHRTLDSGWWFVIPFVDKIRYAYSVKEQGIEIPNQSAITCDNVMVEIDGVLFLRIVDTCKASYNIENPIYNLLNLAQTTMRSEIGRLDLDTLFRERASLNKNIVEVLRSEAADWGIECKRYEIRDITVSELVRRSMDLQADAERRKRQLILQSEGEAQAGINRAEGLRRAQRLAARAEKYSTVLRAEAEVAATTLRAEAVARSAAAVSSAFDAAPNPQSFHNAVGLRVAEQYIEKFGELARRSNTVILGGAGLPVSDPAAFTAQALSIFRAVTNSCGGTGALAAGATNSTSNSSGDPSRGIGSASAQNATCDVTGTNDNNNNNNSNKSDDNNNSGGNNGSSTSGGSGHM